jgi:hypothetical protein
MQLRVHGFPQSRRGFPCNAGIRLVCQAGGAETVDEGDGKRKRVLVMGGTGRVGGSTLRALAKAGDLRLLVGGRNR